MKLQTIQLRNFGSFAEASIDVSDVKTAVVVGQNGAGKSTLCVDSVLWALFGKCRMDTDTMVRLGTDEMAVTVVFALNGQRYRVIRKRSLKTKAGKSDLEFQVEQDGGRQGDVWQPISGARLADTQQKIIELLSADFDLMTSTGFLVQGQAARFSQATPSERKAILAQILRLDQYATLKQAAARAGTVVATQRGEQQKTIDALGGIDAVIDSLRRESTTIEAQRARIAEELAGLDRDRTALIEAQARDRALLQSLEQVPAQLAKAHARRQDLKARERGLLDRRSRLEKIAANRAVIEAKVEEERAATSRLGSVQTEERMLIERIEDLGATIRAGQAEAAKGRELTITLQVTQQAVTAAVFAYQAETAALGHQRATVQRQIDEAVRGYQQETDRQRTTIEADDQAVQLLGQVPCDAALQGRCQFTIQAVSARTRLETSRPALTARLTDVPAMAELVAAELVADRERLSRQIGERMTEEAAIGLAAAPVESATVRSMTQEIEAWRALGWEQQVAVAEQEETQAKADRQTLVAEQAALRTKLDALNKFTALVPELAAADRDLAQLTADLNAMILDMADLNAEIEADTRRLSERQQVLARQAQADLDLAQTYQRQQERTATDQNLSRQAGQVAERLQQAELDAIQARDLAKTLEVLDRDLRHYQALVEAYTVIPVLVLESSIPLLEEEANRILAKISTSGLRVRVETQKALKSRDGLAETLDITVRDVYGERPYETYSGGEKARVDLAIRIGLSRLLANRAGARLETLVVDEAFAAVDREGVEQLVECLPMLSQEFPLVLFVTHDEEFKSSVAQQIVVRKNGNGSTVEVLA